jgi:hypothetical protein
MMMRLATWITVAWMAGTGIALATDPDQLTPSSETALSPEAMANTTARGTDGSAGAAADVTEKDVNLHSEANASASVTGPLVLGPATTGDIGSGALQGAQGLQPSFFQMSTGVGNIQQGVSAIALSQ